MPQWLTDMVNAVLAWFATQFHAVLDSLNPVLLVNSVAASVAAQLPAPSAGLADAISTATVALSAFLDYISFIDYFVDLPLLVSLVAIILTIESALALVRVWRLVRSFII